MTGAVGIQTSAKTMRGALGAVEESSLPTEWARAGIHTVDQQVPPAYASICPRATANQADEFIVSTGTDTDTS